LASDVISPARVFDGVSIPELSGRRLRHRDSGTNFYALRDRWAYLHQTVWM